MTAIIGPAAAKAALTKLLAGIEAALEGAGAAGTPAYGAAVDKAQQDLETFFKRTTAADLADSTEVAAVRAIDELAFNTLIKLSLTEMQGNIKILQEGAETLKKLGGQLDAQAKTNVAAAGSIGLKPVKDAIDKMTDMVNSVKALKANLKMDDPDEAKIATEIGKLVAQFKALKDAADKV